jgi:hypothetical protein
MNKIWECKLFLRRKNPKKTSKEPFLKASCSCLVILTPDGEIADLKTKWSVIDRTISKKVDSKYDHTHIIDCVPIKDLGNSLATH